MTSGTCQPETTGNHARRRSYLPAALAICAGLGFSLAAFSAVRHWLARAVHEEFNCLAESRATILTAAIENELSVLESIRSFFAGSREVERHEFREFVGPSALARLPIDFGSRKESDRNHPDRLHHVTPLEATGCRWSIASTPAPCFVPAGSAWRLWAVLVGGLILTALLVTHYLVGIKRAAHVGRLVDERTRQLRESEGKLHAMLQSIPDHMSMLDRDLNIVWANETARKAFGDDIEPFPCLTLKAFRDGRIHQHQTRVVDKDGRTLCLQCAANVALRNEDGRPTAVLEISRDVTDRQRTQAELAQAKQDAEAANRAKSAFLANMSHEIRTPMTAILGFADLLLADVEKPETAEAAEAIKRNGEHLLKVINDILDLSRIEAGKLRVERIPCSFRRILDEVVSLMRVRADAKGLTLTTECDGPIPQIITTDPTRLRQILVNLIGNALKFTELGGVRVVVRLADERGGRERGDGQRDSRVDQSSPLAPYPSSLAPDCPPLSTVQDAGGGPRLLFDIIDTGIGITEEQIGILFDPFTQGDTSTCRKFGGTGLGLTISHRLAMALGGDLTVTSTPGKGSTFSVRIATGPLQSGAGEQGAAISDQQSAIGNQQSAVSNQQSAVSGQNRQSSIINHPLSFPLPSPQPPIPDPNQGSPSEASPGPQTPDGRTKLNCRILLAENVPDNQRLISRLLRRAGAVVTIAANGREAMEKALASYPGWGRRYDDPTEPFDLVLMEMEMPVMNGYETTRRLRAEGYLGPILALTAHAMSQDRRKCLDAGCDDYMSKPIDGNLLVATVAKHAARVRGQGSGIRDQGPDAGEFVQRVPNSQPVAPGR
jgi:signal transduction histidine kinase/AmiR/NasT family two-component response regulator